jgi:hypothetical protein
MAFLALVLGCALACAAQAPADQVPPELPVSVERIRARLQQPAALRQAVDRQPDFRATVTEDFSPAETVLEALRRNLAGDVTPKRIPPGTIAPPLASVEALHIVTHVKRQLAAALRGRGERKARAEVAAALAEFCAQHDCSVVEQESKQSIPEGVLTH